MADNYDDDIFGEGLVNGDLGGMKVRTSPYYLPVIFIIDCSRSMDEGGRIGSVNSALKELRYKLCELKNNNSLDLRIAVMSFVSSVKWELELTPVEEVVFDTMTTRPGLTRYGGVFSELNRVLSDDEIMKYTGKRCPPAILFLTDGEPTDNYSYKLNELLNNKYFPYTSRCVVLIGDAVDSDSAKAAFDRFVNDPKDIVPVGDSAITEIINTETMRTIRGATKHSGDNNCPDAEDDDQTAGNDASADLDDRTDNGSASGQDGKDPGPFDRDFDPFDRDFEPDDTATGGNDTSGDNDDGDVFKGTGDDVFAADNGDDIFTADNGDGSADDPFGVNPFNDPV
ncbi:MAG: hypothetical protein K5886_04375 [Lachnospiraceae bacterium]|nr:hypothetical protein [Lachnospiraceae bacterium]